MARVRLTRAREDRIAQRAVTKWLIASESTMNYLMRSGEEGVPGGFSSGKDQWLYAAIEDEIGDGIEDLSRAQMKTLRDAASREARARMWSLANGARFGHPPPPWLAEWIRRLKEREVRQNGRRRSTRRR